MNCVLDLSIVHQTSFFDWFLTTFTLNQNTLAFIIKLFLESLNLVYHPLKGSERNRIGLKYLLLEFCKVL